MLISEDQRNLLEIKKYFPANSADYRCCYL
jgi:hypothetical protein